MDRTDAQQLTYGDLIRVNGRLGWISAIGPHYALAAVFYYDQQTERYDLITLEEAELVDRANLSVEDLYQILEWELSR